MKLSTRDPRGRHWVLLLVAGCSKVVDGRARDRGAAAGLAGPLDAVRARAVGRLDIPRGRRMRNALGAGRLTPKPDGDVAQIAMIRFKATGDKIGSLVINPGGPGESGVEAAASMVGTLPDVGAAALRPGRLRSPRGRELVRPRCGATPTPTTTGCGPTRRSTTRPRVSRTSRRETKEFVQRCVDKMGKEFLANVGTASVVKDLDAIRAALGDEKLTYLGYSYGTRIGAATPRPTRRTCAR